MFNIFTAWEAADSCFQLGKIFFRISKDGSNRVLKEEGIKLVAKGRDLGINYLAGELGKVSGRFAYRLLHKKKKKS